MRARSKIWQKLAARGRFSVQSKAIINGKEYTAISAPKINRQSMPSVLSVGNCCSASLEFSVLLEEGDSIPESAEIVIKSRLYEGDEDTKKVSEWLPFGTFYIDHRDDAYDGLVKIYAYDAMLKIDQKFVADSNYNTLGWPLSMKAVVEYIANRIGVGIDPRTVIKTGSDYVVPLPSELTVRQVLGYIAQCHGGNWIITEENLLRLVPLVQIPNDTYHIISADFEDIIVPPEHTLVWQHSSATPVADLTSNSVAKVAITAAAKDAYHIIDEEGKYIVTRDGYTLIWAKDGDAYAVNGIIRVPVVKGKLSTSPKLIVTNVIASKTITTLTTDAESGAISEQTTTTSYTAAGGSSQGHTLDAGNCPYMTQQICNDLLAEYSGLVYAPYEVTSAVYDPAVEIGDQIKIGNTVASVIYNAAITLNIAFSADLKQPMKEESNESEYKYNPEGAKLQDLVDSIQTSITRLDNSIRLRVARAESDSEDRYDAVIEMFADYTPTGDIITAINASADRITLTAGRLVITSGNFQLDANGNVTVTNGNFKGVIETGVDNDNFGIKLDKGEMSITQRGTKYFRIMSSDWGKGTNPNAPFGAQIRAESFLAFNDINGAMYGAFNFGANPNGFTRGFLIFTDSEFCDDVKIQSGNSLYLGTHEITFNGSAVNCDSVITAYGFTLDDAPLDGTSATSVSACLRHLERRIENLES